jgi:hypothetical protein
MDEMEAKIRALKAQLILGTTRTLKRRNPKIRALKAQLILGTTRTLKRRNLLQLNTHLKIL